MTREEALCYFKRRKKIFGLSDEVQEAEDMAIKALEQEPCEDCISRQAVLAYIKRIQITGLGKKKSFDFIKKYVENQPSITPAPKMGHWIAIENEEMETVGYYCSECDLPMETEQWTDFCPNCGSYNGGGTKLSEIPTGSESESSSEKPNK